MIYIVKTFNKKIIKVAVQKFFIVLLIWAFSIFTKSEDEIAISEGNLSLPSSQQPGPLFSFGQNIIDKGDFQFFAYIDKLKGENKNLNGFTPAILYGITDNLSIFTYVPISSNYKFSNFSSGIEDLFVQAEYAFYTNAQKKYSNTATILANISFPTGNSKKNPPTSSGSVSFFVGSTISHLSIDWYCFASAGAQIPINKKLGNTMFAEFGFGRNISYSPDKWLLTWMIEFDFIHSNNAITKKRSSTNDSDILFIGPSLLFSTQKLILQAGISFPAYQKLRNLETNSDFYTAICIGWKFN